MAPSVKSRVKRKHVKTRTHPRSGVKRGGLGASCKAVLEKDEKDNLNALLKKVQSIPEDYRNTPVYDELNTMIDVLKNYQDEDPKKPKNSECLQDFVARFQKQFAKTKSGENKISPTLFKNTKWFIFMTISQFVKMVTEKVDDLLKVLGNDGEEMKNEALGVGKKIANLIKFCTIIFADPAVQAYVFAKYKCPLRLAAAHYAIHRSKILNIVAQNMKTPVTITSFPIPHNRQLYMPMMCSLKADTKPVFGNFYDDSLGQVMDAIVASRSEGESPYFDPDPTPYQNGGTSYYQEGGKDVVFKLSKEFKFLEISTFKDEVKKAQKIIDAYLVKTQESMRKPQAGGILGFGKKKANANANEKTEKDDAKDPSKDKDKGKDKEGEDKGAKDKEGKDKQGKDKESEKEAKLKAKEEKEKAEAAEKQARNAKKQADANAKAKAAEEKAKAVEKIQIDKMMNKETNKLVKFYNIYSNQTNMIKPVDKSEKRSCYGKDSSTASDEKVKLDMTQFSPDLIRQAIDDYMCYLRDDTMMQTNTGEKAYLHKLFHMTLDAIENFAPVQIFKNTADPAQKQLLQQVLGDVAQYSADGLKKIKTSMMPKLMSYLNSDKYTNIMNNNPVWCNDIAKASVAESFIETLLPIAQQIYTIVEALFGRSIKFYMGKSDDDFPDGRPNVAKSGEEFVENTTKGLQQAEERITKELNRVSMLIEIVMRQQLIIDILVELLLDNFDKTMSNFLYERIKLPVLHVESVKVIFEDIVIKVIQSYFKIRTPVYIRIKSYALMKSKIVGIVDKAGKETDKLGGAGKAKICAIIATMFKNIEENVLKTLTDDLKANFFKASNQRIVAAVNELDESDPKCTVGQAGGKLVIRKFKPTTALDVIRSHQKIMKLSIRSA